MPRQPVYQTLEVYQLSKKLVVACYALTNELHQAEAANFVRYIRTASLNVHINVAQIAFASPGKRKKRLKDARSALIIVEAAVDILFELGLITEDHVEKIDYFSKELLESLDKM